MLYPDHIYTGDNCNESDACRRMFPRLKPQGNVYIAYGNRAPYVGELKDAGMGGVSFEYVQIEKPLSTRHHMDILIPELRIRVRQLPCRMIYKTPQPADLNNRYAFVPMQIFRCGLAFTALTNQHITDLEQLLQSPSFNT